MTWLGLNTYCDVAQYMNGLWIFITKTWSAPPRNNEACVIKHGYDIRNRHIDSQSLVTDRLPPPLLSLSLYIKNFFLIGEESDGGHRIKRALYFGIKRLCIDSTKTEAQSLPGMHATCHVMTINQLWCAHVFCCMGCAVINHVCSTRRSALVLLATKCGHDMHLHGQSRGLHCGALQLHLNRVGLI